MARRVQAMVVFLFWSAMASYAAGPAFVAGSGYNAGVEGQPLVWANASVEYFTDQGNLSPILTGTQADAFVATAVSAWTSIPGVTLTVMQAGHLAEDVNGSNIEANGMGMVTAPADIVSTATGTPVGIVYDYDGTVTDAILGEGAGDSSDCFMNAAYGGPDNFAATGNIVHALVVINGVCASTSAQLPDVQYHLVRVLGRILGVGWSQANLNVLTGKPAPTSSDLAGFPVMHYEDPRNCVPISLCYPNAATPKMDDMDALTRLYPASVLPQPSGRIYGSVYFTDNSGNAVQPMQGVNVVARLMVGGQPSRQYVVTSVSGFLFCGNAGNIVTGYFDGNGLRYDRWGSNDPSLEGFYDLGELPIPSGQTIAQYQLSVEALDPNWSLGVEPYTPEQVAPSGSFAPVVVTVVNGGNAERDILMLQDEVAEAHPGSGSTYGNPAPLPAGGSWSSWISGYGSSDWFQFSAQANRTASIAVTALDETGSPTESKALPVIGAWELTDESGNPAPAATMSAFNSPTFGMTRLDAQFGATESYKIGIADFRGDGRPDYAYRASVLYSDSVTPARVGLTGGPVTLNGIGFAAGQQVTVGTSNVSMLSVSAKEISVMAPAAVQDGVANIQVTDPATGGFSQMMGALMYGAQASDQLLMLQATEPATAVGAQGANMIRVRAVAADGVTPVNGATIAWNATNGLLLSVCNATPACSVLSDGDGESSTWVTPMATGVSTITMALAPASYSPAQMQQATVVGTSTAMDLAAVTPTRWIGQGATIALPLTVEALNLGVPKAGVTVNFIVTEGTAALSSSSAVTGSSGLASVTAQLTNQNATVQVSACVAPNNAPCQTFTMFSTPASFWRLETVSGASQAVNVGQAFQPLVMRVTDGTAADDPVMGVTVTFATTLARVGEEAAPGGNGVPVLLGSSQSQVVTGPDGLALMVPSAGNVGPCEVFIAVAAGGASAQFEMENLATVVAPVEPSDGVKRPSEAGATVFRGGGVRRESEMPEIVAVPVGMSGGTAGDSGDGTAADADHPAAGTVAGVAKPDGPLTTVVKAKGQAVKKKASRKKRRPTSVAADGTRVDAKSRVDRRSCRFLAEDRVF